MTVISGDLTIQPIVSYPHQAEVGKTYLMTVDLRLVIALEEWPDQKSEEIAIYCLINTYPLFQVEPLGEPAIVIHRFGGTYGPARFLLKASTIAQEGAIKLTLVNGWGIPIQVIDLDRIQIVSEGAHQARQIETLKRRVALVSEDSSSAYPPTQVASELPSAIEDELIRIEVIKGTHPRLQALETWANNLPVGRLPEVLKIVQNIQDELYCAQILISIALHLPETHPQLLEQALTTIQSIQDGRYRAEALVTIAPQLPETERLQVLEQALSAAQSIQDESDRATALATISPQLPETEPQLLQQMLMAAASIQDERCRAQVLISIAIHFPNLAQEVSEFAQEIQNEEQRRLVLQALSSNIASNSSVIDFSSLIAEKTRNFIGREQVFQAIDDWLPDSHNVRFFLITGESGIGKTAIASRLVQFSRGEIRLPLGLRNLKSGFLKAVHFCSLTNDEWNDPREFSVSISLQLANSIPEFAQALLEAKGKQVNIQIQQSVESTQNSKIQGITIDSLNLSSQGSARDAFNSLVVKPINTIYRNGFKQEVTILVDALDESINPTRKGSIFELLSSFSASLPLEVGFIITSRPLEKEIDRLKAVNLVEEYPVKAVSVSLAKNIQLIPFQEEFQTLDSIQEDTFSAVREAIGELAQGWLELVSDEESSGQQRQWVDYQVINREGEYVINDRTGTPIPNLRPTLMVSDRNSAQTVVERLVHIAKYRAIQELYSPFFNFSDSLEVELLDKDRQPFPKPDNPVLRTEETCYLHVKNKSARSLNIAVLDLEPTWAVSNIPVRGIDEAFYSLEAGQEEHIHLRFSLPSDLEYLEVQEVLKVFATRSSIDCRLLELPSLDEPLLSYNRGLSLRSSVGKAGSLNKFIDTFTREEQSVTRSASVVTSSDEEWTTQQLTITLIAESTSN